MQSGYEQEADNSELSNALKEIVGVAIFLGITEEQLSAKLLEQLHKKDNKSDASLTFPLKRMSNPQAGP